MRRFPSPLDRRILALAIPAFAALVSEPLLLLADSAVIGHLGTVPLAGLGIAGNVLGVLTGLSVFLAYGTTSTVARRLGANDPAGALAGGRDGIVLAVGLGVCLAAALELVLPTVVGWYGTSPAVATAATTYLRIAGWGLPAILVLLAATGVIRGLQDTRTPLVVVVGANVVNVALNVTLVYGVGQGIAGSALGTLVAQTCAAAVLVVVVLRAARREQVPWRPRARGVVSAARQGGWLVARTASLQAGITATTLAAAALGSTALAAHQVTNSIWTLLAFALDAVAIAAQALIGRYLGAGAVGTVRRLTARMVGWGIGAGVVSGGVLAAARPLYERLFSPDPAVQALLAQVLLVVAVLAPLAGVVFVLDGVLIGAGDARYLALAGAVALAAYLPLLLAVRVSGAGLVVLWWAYGGYVVARLLTLAVRARGNRWLRTGHPTPR